MKYKSYSTPSEFFDPDCGFRPINGAGEYARDHDDGRLDWAFSGNPDDVDVFLHEERELWRSIRAKSGANSAEITIALYIAAQDQIPLGDMAPTVEEWSNRPGSRVVKLAAEHRDDLLKIIEVRKIAMPWDFSEPNRPMALRDVHVRQYHTNER